MNLKIADLDKTSQTDKVHKQAQSLILSFVRKYLTHYHPHHKDDADEIASQLYLEFIRPKAHRNGEEFSELDRFDPEATGDWSGNKLATYVKRFVINRLIDMERSDKAESHYSEKYNPDEGSEASIDYLANALEQAQDDDFNPDEFEVTPDLLLAARDKFDDMSYEQQQEFAELYKEQRAALSPEFRKLFDDLLSGVKENSDDPFKAAIVEVLGKCDVSTTSTSKGETLRITAADRVSSDDVAKLKDVLDKEGYRFYKGRGNSVYFLKNE